MVYKMKRAKSKNLKVIILKFIYDFLFYLILPFLPLRLWIKARKNKLYAERIKERFGRYSFPKLESSIWVHAVSLGESVAALPLIEELINHYPKKAIVVTNMTPTGSEQIKKSLGDRVLQLYVPYDYSGAVKRFLDQVNPRILVIMETELWPNIIYHCCKRNISIVIANACLSQRSFTRYKYIAGTIGYLLNCTTFVIAQNKTYGNRFTKLGLSRNRLLVMGNIKFDLKIPETLNEQALELRKKLGLNRPIWVAASTHAQEEEKILTAAAKINETVTNALLILIPRHPERFAEVAKLCAQKNFKFIRYSEQQDCNVDVNVIVGDVMGQLLLFYAIANVAFVGGSLVPHGGHNILQPAALEKPIITGNHYENFADIIQLFLDNDALITVHDEMALAQNVVELLQDKNLRKQYGVAAREVIEKNQGATRKILHVIYKLVK